MARTIEQKRESARKAMAKKRAADPAGAKAYGQTYRSMHKDELREKEKAYRAKHREYYAALSRAYHEKHREDKREYNRRFQAKQRSAVFAFYGGANPKCECCNENHWELLTIDHVGGGGNKHRKEIGNSGLYGWLIKNNFPDGFRVLCMNCNWAIGLYGYCPHRGPGAGE